MNNIQLNISVLLLVHCSPFFLFFRSFSKLMVVILSTSRTLHKPNFHKNTRQLCALCEQFLQNVPNRWAISWRNGKILNQKYYVMKKWIFPQKESKKRNGNWGKGKMWIFLRYQWWICIRGLGPINSLLCII